MEIHGDALDELLQGDDSYISEWLTERDLLHVCDCGYFVYDDEAMNHSVQDEFGSERCDEIFDWACNLSNRFGWMGETGSHSKFGIYHCQYCAASEFSLLLDLEKISSRAGDGKPTNFKRKSKGNKKKEHFVVYIDESFSPGFPRKPSDSYAYAGVIVPDSQVRAVNKIVGEIIRQSYRGSRPKELKYQRYFSRPRLLEKIGEKVSKFLTETQGIAVIALYVPANGYLAEQVRSLRAIAHYGKKLQKPEKMKAVHSKENIEKAVRKIWKDVGIILAAAVAEYIAGRGGQAKIYFDPVGESQEKSLIKVLREILPKLPVDQPIIRWNDKIVTVQPSKNMKKLGKRIRFVKSPRSENSPGLQLADFCAGDVRAFFGENQGFLHDALTDALLTSKNVLFPEIFQVKPANCALMKKLANRKGKSFLPEYRTAFAHGLISYYTSNGHMRLFDIANAEYRDLVD